MKTRHTFTVDAELIGRVKGLVAGSKGRLSLAGLVAMVLTQIVRRLERSGMSLHLVLFGVVCSKPLRRPQLQEILSH